MEAGDMKTKLGFIGMLIGSAGMLALPALAQEHGNYRNNTNASNYATQQQYSTNQQVYAQPQYNTVRSYGNSYGTNSYRSSSYGNSYVAPQSYERSDRFRRDDREWARRHRRDERRFRFGRWDWR
jgi:hypothetical protein